MTPPEAPLLSEFKIKPALPTLWSTYEVPESLLKAHHKSQAQLEKIYRDALEAPGPIVMPISVIGGSKLSIPAFTLGGPPFLFGMAFKTNRKLWGWMPAVFYPPLNLVMIPLGIVGACVAILPAAYNLAAGLAGGFAWITITGGLAVWEQTRYSTQVMEKALALKINHIETARHYLTSEAYMRPVIRNVGREKLVIQTKVRPYAGAAGFVETVEACCDTLAVERLDMLALHGVNVPAFLDGARACADAVRGHPKVRELGFSFHCPTDHAIGLIQSGKFSFVNMHFNFFGGYTCLTNERAVAAAAAKKVGVMCISPNGQSGHLHTNPTTLAALCAPLSPMEFNLLFQLTYPGVSSTSLGPGALSHFDLPSRVLRLLPVAKDLLPPVVDRLRRAAQAALGEPFLRGAAGAVEHTAQGGGSWDAGKEPIALSLLVMAASINKAFGLRSFGRAMHANLSWPGDWCAGLNADAVHGREEEVRRNCHVGVPGCGIGGSGGGSGGGGKSKGACCWGVVEQDACLEMLLRYSEDMGLKRPAKPANRKGSSSSDLGSLARSLAGKCAGKIWGFVFNYVVWWMAYSSGLFGFRQTKEFGSMPKTVN